MTSASRFVATLVLVTGVAGCDSIGDGSTLETLTLSTSPGDVFVQGVFLEAGTANERFHMYDCFCTNLVALGRFTNGVQANFNQRATFSSSNPAVLTVLNPGDTDTLCPAGQRGAGLMIPHSVGTATVTVSFAGLSDTLVVEVADASAGTYTVEGAPPAPPGSTHVAVGAEMQLRLTGMLDGTSRNLNFNVLQWSFDNPDEDVATIDSAAIVRGFAASGAAAKVARASFGVCNDLSPTASINIGDVLPPLVLEREAPDFATDGMLAVASDELLRITAPLDFDNDGIADGSQRISQQIDLRFTDTCTLRTHDANVPTTNCLETPGAACSEATPECGEVTPTTCAATMTPCRTADAAIIDSGTNNRIFAQIDNGAPTNFTAVYPHQPGTPTGITAAIDAVATTVTVGTLTNYPTSTPWYAVIDAAGAREDVKVTATAAGNTLTIVRGQGGTTAVPHAFGATFIERTYTTDLNAPLVIRAKEGNLTDVAIDPPGTLASLGTLQLAARGTFVDPLSASRQQKVTRLIGTSTATTPTIVWTSSDDSIAFVGINSGLVFSQDRCGGRVNIRVRSDTSTDPITEHPHDPDTTADDVACENTDPLCDQVELCIATPSPVPLGIVCDTVTTCP